MKTIGVWRSLYRVIKSDVLGDFRSDVSESDADSFEQAVMQVAVACNTALSLIASDRHSDLGLAANTVIYELQKLVELGNSTQVKMNFEEHIASVSAHLDELQLGVSCKGLI